jgi:hypothetical protein
MDISKNGNVSNTKYPGNLSVKGNVNAGELNVQNNASINGTLSVNNILLNGKDLNQTVNEAIYETLQTSVENKPKDCLYLGNQEEENSWRFRIVNGELLIEKLEEGEWNIKQSIE